MRNVIRVLSLFFLCLTLFGQFGMIRVNRRTAAPAAIVGPADSFINCNTSTPGTTLTTTILNNCTQGNGNLGGWGNSGAYTGFTIQAHQTGCSLGGSVVINGVSFPTSTTSQAIAHDDSTATPSYISNTTASVGMTQGTLYGCYIPGPSSTIQALDKIFDPISIFGGNGTYVVMQLSTGNCGGVANQYGVRIHYQDSGGGSQVNGCVVLTPRHAYIYSVHADFVSGAHSISIFDPSSSYAQVGSTLTPSGSTKTSDGSSAMTIRLGQNQTATDTQTSYFENTVFQFSGQAITTMGPTNTTYNSPYVISKVFNTSALSGAATTTVSPAIALQQGVSNWVWNSYENASGTTSGCTDTAGNTYSRATSVNLATQGHGELWYAANTTANASNVVTCTHTSSTFRNIIVTAVGGGNTSTPLDVTATGTQSSGANVTTGSFTPTTSTGSVLACGYITAGAALTADTNYETINTSATTSAACEFRYAAPNSAQTASLIQSNTSSKWMIAAAIKK